MNLEGHRFLVFVEDVRSEEAVRAALPPSAPVRVAGVRDSAGFVIRLMQEASPDMVIVDCSRDPQQALRVLHEVANVGHDCSIVALSTGDANGFITQAFRAGADDLIVLPLPADQFGFALQKVLARRRAPGANAAKAPMIAILGPKGGTGKTMTACNLVVGLAELGARAVILDLDLQFGDVGLALGLKPDRTIYDLVTTGGTLDTDKVETFVVRHRSGAAALLAPTRPDQAAVVTNGFLNQLFDVLRFSYDFVVVDTPPAFSPEVIAAIDAASHLCVVGMLDALSLKDTKIGFETLQQMGYPADEVMLVLNRADSSVGISMNDVYALLKKGPDVLVPSDRAIPRALTVGETILEADPKSGAGRAFARLTDIYAAVGAGTTGDDVPDVQPAARRRLSLRRGN